MGRLRRREISTKQLRNLAYLLALVFFLVIASGSIVRLTGSGLGCENWPRCGEAPFPTEATSYHPIVEFANRVVAAIGIVLALYAWLVAQRVKALSRTGRWSVLLVFLCSVAQIPLGGVTVLTDLHPVAVMSHFLLGLITFAFAIAFAHEARLAEVGRAPQLVPGVIARLAVVMFVACSALVVTGAFSTAAGPHPGADADVKRLFTVEGTVYIHVRANAVYGVILAILLAVFVWKRVAAPRLLASSAGLLVLLGGQMLVGEIQYSQGLPWWQVVIHVTLSAAVWAWSGWLALALYRPPLTLTLPVRARSGSLPAG